MSYPSLSTYSTPHSLSSSSRQGFGVTWASLGLSFIVGLSGYGTANGKNIYGCLKSPKHQEESFVGLNLSVGDNTLKMLSHSQFSPHGSTEDLQKDRICKLI